MRTKDNFIGAVSKSLILFILIFSASIIVVAQKFSDNTEVQKQMEQGESAFKAKNYDGAIKFYKKALELESTNYYAALFIGDMYFRKNDFDKAETWFQKAIVINPNIETAYRYSATPLMQQQKYAKARDRYIEAYITEPYNSRTARTLTQWGKITKTSTGHPRIDFPADVSTSDDGTINITLGGLGDDKNDGSFAWTVYGLSRATWQSSKDGLSKDFKKAYPKEKTYRRSLAEEYDALKSVVTVLKERMVSKDKPVKKLDPQLKTLLELHNKGLLESFILLAKANKGIAKDHPEYLKTNRAKLRQYVMEYVIAKQ